MQQLLWPKVNEQQLVVLLSPVLLHMLSVVHDADCAEGIAWTCLHSSQKKSGRDWSKGEPVRI